MPTLSSFLALSVLLILIVGLITVRLLRNDFISPRRTYLVGSFFAAYLLIGLLVFRDYGVSVDEIRQRTHGAVALKYIIQIFNPEMAESLFPRVTLLAKYPHRLYGVSFHLPLMGMEMMVDLSDQNRELWYFRHLYTFLFFYLGVVALYRLVAEKCGWVYGLISALFLVTTPRLFSESFYNIKDTTFLAAFSIALFSGFRFWRHPTYLSALIAGATAGFATNIRVVGVVLIPVVVALGSINLLVNRPKERNSDWFAPKREIVCLISILLISFYGVVIATAPASWANPSRYLVDCLRNFSDYRAWNGTFMYLGEDIRGRNVPWHYIPVSMLITIPPIVLALFGVGVLLIGYEGVSAGVRLIFAEGRGKALRGRIEALKEVLRSELPENITFLFLVFFPVLGAIVRKSTLYSGWRHFTFIYSCLLIVAMLGLKSLLLRCQNLERKDSLQSSFRIFSMLKLGIPAILGVLTAIHLSTIGWMFVHHPFHIGYFNSLVYFFGGAHKFDRDYMRATYLPALKMMEQFTSEKGINVAALNSGSQVPLLKKNIIFLDQQAAARIQPVADELQADYLIDSYRVFSKRFPPEARKLALVGEVAPDGLGLFSIYSVARLREMMKRTDENGSSWLSLSAPPFLSIGSPVTTKGVPINFDWDKGFNGTTLRIRLPKGDISWVRSRYLRFRIRQPELPLKNIRSKTRCDGARPRRVKPSLSGPFEWLYEIDEDALVKKGELSCVFLFSEPIYASGVEIRAAAVEQLLESNQP